MKEKKKNVYEIIKEERKSNHKLMFDRLLPYMDKERNLMNEIMLQFVNDFNFDLNVYYKSKNGKKKDEMKNG